MFYNELFPNYSSPAFIICVKRKRRYIFFWILQELYQSFSPPILWLGVCLKKHHSSEHCHHLCFWITCYRQPIIDNDSSKCSIRDQCRSLPARGWKSIAIMLLHVLMKSFDWTLEYHDCVLNHIKRTCETNTLEWHHNERDSVSNHQPHDCLLNRLFRRRSKKTSKLRVTGLCVGISPGPVNSPHKWPVTRKMFPFDDVIIKL